MKVLYIGQVNSGGTCLSRLRSLEELGHECRVFDTSPFTLYSFKLYRSLAHRWNFGPVIYDMNADLRRFVEELDFQPDFVWIDKGRWIWKETLQVIKSRWSCQLVHYTPDPQIIFNKSRFFFETIPLYDVMFTTKPFEVRGYKRLGARNIRLIHQSYDSGVIYPIWDMSGSELNADVCFIGRCEAHYARVLKRVAALGVNLKIWGPYWERYAILHPWVKPFYMGSGVWGNDYNRALNGARISICLLSKRYPESTTTRTFEIPGAGTLMLAERTTEHQKLFEEDRDAVFFDSADEAASKVRYFLDKDELVDRIGENGYNAVKGKHDNTSRMRNMLRELVNV